MNVELCKWACCYCICKIARSMSLPSRVQSWQRQCNLLPFSSSSSTTSAQRHCQLTPQDVCIEVISYPCIVFKHDQLVLMVLPMRLAGSWQKVQVAVWWAQQDPLQDVMWVHMSPFIYYLGFISSWKWLAHCFLCPAWPVWIMQHVFLWPNLVSLTLFSSILALTLS